MGNLAFGTGECVATEAGDHHKFLSKCTIGFAALSEPWHGWGVSSLSRGFVRLVHYLPEKER